MIMIILIMISSSSSTIIIIMISITDNAYKARFCAKCVLIAVYSNKIKKQQTKPQTFQKNHPYTGLHTQTATTTTKKKKKNKTRKKIRKKKRGKISTHSI